jgi:uncharacterized protein YbbK (DUF523 family)
MASPGVNAAKTNYQPFDYPSLKAGDCSGLILSLTSHPALKGQSLARPKYQFLVSACRAGYNCTCKGKNNLKRPVKKLVDSGRALPACPETMGGLPVPRENSEIAGGDGGDVLRKKARVLSVSGKDLTSSYLLGAKRTARLAIKHNIRKAILKSNSPACGRGRIYDGTFRRKLKPGDGVLTALLRASGIRVRASK